MAPQMTLKHHSRHKYHKWGIVFFIVEGGVFCEIETPVVEAD